MNNLAGLGVVATLFLFVLAILWFLLPFAVFGTKPLLGKMLAELQMLNKTMKEISAQNRVLVEQQKLFLPRASKVQYDE